MYRRNSSIQPKARMVANILRSFFIPTKLPKIFNINLVVRKLNSVAHKESYNKNEKIGGNLSRSSVNHPYPNTNFSIVIAKNS
jgi:hypothetical protein